MTDFEKSFAEVRDIYDMLAARRPDMKEQLDLHMTETAKEITEIFQPLTDYSEGKITWEEYQAIMDVRHQEDQQRRRVFYGDEPVLFVHCAECGREHEWDVEEHDNELPPIYFECEDATGDDCRDEENEDE